VEASGSDRLGLVEAGRDGGLAAAVVAPGDDRAVVLEREAVGAAAGDRLDVRGGGRGDGGLAVEVAAKGDDRAVVLEREAVGAAGGDRLDVRGGGGYGGLAEAVVAPGDDRAVLT
jgi:hypothetical protein